jgi:hypothetical protein
VCLALQDQGWLTQEQLQALASWAPARAEAALSGLLGEGLAWVDDGARDRVRRFWFPCVGMAAAASTVSVR